jgi:D-alanyl-lipoteichoic acid acyltransferase DltB (MBOAT superfamily)
VIDYGFYVSFFPQLVAGPIVRANEFVGQLHKPYFLSKKWFGIAVFWILNGLAKKIILSDYLAVNFVDRVFANPTMFGGFENVMALFVYSLQIYADFSGYTDIAIGVALMMGFRLPTNFRSPYKARNCSEFWKRWHISLSKWLQDYLYISMGGNREASTATFVVILTITVIGTVLSGSIWVAVIAMIVVAACGIAMVLRPDKRKGLTSNINRMNTMLLGGLWHGASWNFMIWGGLNGIGMLIYRSWHTFSVHLRTVVTVTLSGALVALAVYTTWEYALLNIAAFWIGAIAVTSALRSLYNVAGFRATLPWLDRSNAIVNTFVFVSFTRLFFRSGSNLDPAEANQVAFETASQMVTQIGTTWNLGQIPTIVSEYWQIFVLFAVGMVIHWLSEDIKRRYRICFARMHPALLCIVAMVAVLVIYQFATADLQKFVYFQF